MQCYNTAMEITIRNKTNRSFGEMEQIFADIACSAEVQLNLADDLEISVTFVRSVTIHKINRNYRGIDRPTDVISFAARDGMDEFLPEEERKDLGDLFINIQYAARQAKEYGHSEKRELAFLFTHGLLHCLGYDHMNEPEAEKMFALQRKILDPIVSRDE